jgi:hypothetical protein
VRIVKAVERAVTIAALGLARLVLPAFGVVPPEWLMNRSRKRTSPSPSSSEADASDSTGVAHDSLR